MKDFFVHLLCIFFGLGSWLSVNSLFNELPLLVSKAPEGWSLASYLSLIVQLANLGPILYSFVRKKCNDRLIVFILLVFGSISMLLMAFLYSKRSYIFEEYHSVSLFILVFCSSLLCCSSSVLFIPLMNEFPVKYLFSYMAGEGFSGLVPSIISLIQGVGGNPKCVKSTDDKIIQVQDPPRFSIEVYFIIVTLVMVLSTFSFVFLHYFSFRKSPTLNENVATSHNCLIEKELSKFVLIILCILTAIVSSFSNGALPSIQPYSTLPYGNTAYHLAVSLSNISNPFACFVSNYLPVKSLRLFVPSLVLTTLFVIYVFTVALLSPNPPLKNSISGEVIIVISWTVCVGLISFVKMSIARMCRDNGKTGLYAYGAASQIGAALGSIVAFLLVNTFKVFTTFNPCETKPLTILPS